MGFARSVSAVLLLATQAGCAAQIAAYQAQQLALQPRDLVWDIRLTNAERPNRSDINAGTPTISVVSRGLAPRLAFDDSLVRITFSASDARIGFDLTNKTDRSIKIVWDDAAFVDLMGKSGPVMHEGVKFSECSGPKTPSIVVRQGSITDEVISCGQVSTNYGLAVGSFLYAPKVTNGNVDEVLQQLHRTVIGKTVSLLLPLQIAGTSMDYLFTFTVAGVTAPPNAP